MCFLCFPPLDFILPLDSLLLMGMLEELALAASAILLAALLARAWAWVNDMPLVAFLLALSGKKTSLFELDIL